MKLILRLVFMASLAGIVGLSGCSENDTMILVSEKINVYGSFPKSIVGDDLEVIGILEKGSQVAVLSVSYQKDYAVYEIDLSVTELGARSGYVYIDSRYMSELEKE